MAATLQPRDLEQSDFHQIRGMSSEPEVKRRERSSVLAHECSGLEGQSLKVSSPSHILARLLCQKLDGRDGAFRCSMMIVIARSHMVVLRAAGSDGDIVVEF